MAVQRILWSFHLCCNWKLESTWKFGFFWIRFILLHNSVEPAGSVRVVVAPARPEYKAFVYTKFVTMPPSMYKWSSGKQFNWLSLKPYTCYLLVRFWCCLYICWLLIVFLFLLFSGIGCTFAHLSVKTKNRNLHKHFKSHMCQNSNNYIISSLINFVILIYIVNSFFWELGFWYLGVV